MNHKEINFNKSVSIQKIERKLNQMINTIENNFFVSDGTGIRKNIETNVYSAGNYLTFAFQAKLESALPDKKQFRAFIYTKLLAELIEEKITSIYKEKGIDILPVNNFPYSYVKENEENNGIYSVSCSRLSCGEFRYMDILQIICYVKSKILNGEEIVNKFVSLLSDVKREILTEIINYNGMQAEFDSILLLKDTKTSLEFWLKSKDEKTLLVQVKKENQNLKEFEIDIKNDIYETYFYVYNYVRKIKEFIKEVIVNELRNQ